MSGLEDLMLRPSQNTLLVCQAGHSAPLSLDHRSSVRSIHLQGFVCVCVGYLLLQTKTHNGRTIALLSVPRILRLFNKKHCPHQLMRWQFFLVGLRAREETIAFEVAIEVTRFWSLLFLDGCLAEECLAEYWEGEEAGSVESVHEQLFCALPKFQSASRIAK